MPPLKSLGSDVPLSDDHCLIGFHDNGELVHQVTITWRVSTIGGADSTSQYPLKKKDVLCSCEVWKRGGCGMIKITEFSCWTIIENQSEGRERCTTHSKNTLLHYHEADFVTST